MLYRVLNIQTVHSPLEINSADPRARARGVLVVSVNAVWEVPNGHSDLPWSEYG